MIRRWGVVNDQFHPSIAVDGQGVIHVTFYDDRDFEDQNDNTASGVRLNMYYTFSENDGVDWAANRHLFLDPFANPADDACFDLLEDSAADFFFHVGEYTGLRVRELSHGEREIWISFTGTVDEGDDPEESIIWVARVPWQNP